MSSYNKYDLTIAIYTLVIGYAVSLWTPESDLNPEELGEYAQGDLLIPPGNFEARNGLRATSTHWPKGVIPYEISPYFSKYNVGDIIIVYIQ